MEMHPITQSLQIISSKISKQYGILLVWVESNLNVNYAEQNKVKMNKYIVGTGTQFNRDLDEFSKIRTRFTISVFVNLFDLNKE